MPDGNENKSFLPSAKFGCSSHCNCVLEVIVRAAAVFQLLQPRDLGSANPLYSSLTFSFSKSSNNTILYFAYNKAKRGSVFNYLPKQPNLLFEIFFLLPFFVRNRTGGYTAK